MKKQLLCAVLLAALPSASALADVFSTYGDVVVAGSSYQITADPSGLGYGGLQDQITGALDPNQLTTLSANYSWLAGTYAPAVTPTDPRFTLYDTSDNAAYVYWGADTGSTGNLAGGAALDVYVAGFGGLGGSTYSPLAAVSWATFLAEAGNVDLSYITLDVDAPANFSTALQEIDVTSMTVNSSVYSPSAVPEPATLSLMGLGMVGLFVFARKQSLLQN